MKSFFLLILFFCLLASSSLAQPPDSLWSRTFGGSSFESCSAVQQTPDGGYVLAGTTTSFGAGGSDFWLVKTNSDGDSLWSRTFGRSGNEDCAAVQQTSDGGYVLAGTEGINLPYGSDFMLVKTDANGDSLWGRIFGGSGGDRCDAVRQTLDGGYVLAGSTNSFGAGSEDFWLVKTNANGDSLWSRTFGGGYTDDCYAVQQTLDGGYVLVGTTSSFGAGSGDFWLVKTNPNGDSLWSRAFGGHRDENCFAVQQTSDGGYVLAGGTSSFGAGGTDFWLVKTNSNGDSLWSRTFGRSDGEWCTAVQQTSDGGYALAGTAWRSGYYDFWLVKTNANGDSLWSRIFGGSNYEACYAVQQTSDGGYVLAGLTESFGAGGEDFWLVRTEPELSTDEPSILHPSSFVLSTFPNPFNSKTTIRYELPQASQVRVRIFNLLGQEVAQLVDGRQLTGTHTITWDAGSCPSGIYVCRMEAVGFAQTRKMLLVK